MNRAADELRRVKGIHGVVFISHARHRLALRLFLDALQVGAELGSEGVKTAAASGSTNR